MQDCLPVYPSSRMPVTVQEWLSCSQQVPSPVFGHCRRGALSTRVHGSQELLALAKIWALPSREHEHASCHRGRSGSMAPSNCPFLFLGGLGSAASTSCVAVCMSSSSSASCCITNWKLNQRTCTAEHRKCQRLVGVASINSMRLAASIVMMQAFM